MKCFTFVSQPSPSILCPIPFTQYSFSNPLPPIPFTQYSSPLPFFNTSPPFLPNTSFNTIRLAPPFPPNTSFTTILPSPFLSLSSLSSTLSLPLPPQPNLYYNPSLSFLHGPYFTSLNILFFILPYVFYPVFLYPLHSVFLNILFFSRVFLVP